MLMTGQTQIQEVLFFPQMRPEKKAPRDAAAKYVEAGIPEASRSRVAEGRLLFGFRPQRRKGAEDSATDW